MEHRGHGGSCCGRRHIVGMSGASTADIHRLMNQHSLLNGELNKITEIVVSDENETEDMDLDELRANIVEAGFVLVAVWDNDSGSTCYMYLHANDWQAFPNGAAVDVRPPIVAPVAPLAPPRVVCSAYHNVLRAGRSQAGWLSRDVAVAAAPRAQRIDRCDTFSDGTTRWTEGV